MAKAALRVVAADPKLEAKLRKEQRAHERALEADALARETRDDMVSHIRNSGWSYQQIEDAGGPTVKTLSNWELGNVTSPRLTTLALAAKVLGLRVGFVPTNRKK